MNQKDESVAKTSETLAETEEKPVNRSAASRWIEDDETESKDAVKKSAKKHPYIQIPVIISLCLVVVSLLAFFAYKYIFIAEPEGVLWTWYSEEEDADWYFEFEDDNIFKAYFGSFELSGNYLKDKSDPQVNRLTISDASMFGQDIGCLYLGTEIDYTISGNRVAGDQKMTLTYPMDTTGQEFELTQTDKREYPLQLPDDFTEDENLTGEWVNVFSTDSAKQSYIFNDDGSMSLVIRYAFSGDNFFEICRNCTYTVDKNEINITWITNDPVVHHTEYSIKDGMLEIDGAYFYRAGNNPATPDQVKK